MNAKIKKHDPWVTPSQVVEVLIYSDYTKRLPVGDPDDHELVISISAAIMPS